MFLSTSQLINKSNKNDESFVNKKFIKLGNMSIYLDDDDEIILKNNKAFILTGFFFDDEFPKSVKSKAQQLDFLASLKKRELINFLNSIDGFYSLIILNSAGKLLEIYSDHVCSIPVFIHTSENTITISHDHKRLIKKIQNLSLNLKKVINYFMFLNTTSGDTFYKKIIRTLPREYLKISQGKISREEIYCYSHSKYIGANDFESLKNQFKKLFLRSVKNCARDSINISSALSGGLDSSSITSSLEYIGGKNITAKTVIFGNLKGSQNNKVDETYYSNLVAKQKNIEHHKIKLTNTGCISDLKITRKIFPEPTGLVNGYIHHEIFKSLKSSGINTYLDGFAGDSIIGHGYTKLYELGKKFRIFELIKEDRILHEKRGAKYSVLRTIKMYVIPFLIPSKVLWRIDKMRKTKNWQKTWIYRINKKYLNGGVFNKIIKEFGRYPVKITSARSSHLENLKSINISMGIYNASLLAKHYGINIRFPFLSKKLMELSLNTPVKYKLHEGIDRHIFREAMRGITPDAVLNRTTKADMSPFSFNEISNLDDQKILNSLKKNTGDFFDYDFLKKEIFSKKSLNFAEIYQMYEFNEWLEIEGLKLD